jgi:chromosome partitioning protein
VSLGAALAESGQRVLVIDLDPQGNASTGLGLSRHPREVTVYDVLSSDSPIEDAVVPTDVPGLFAAPSTIDLAGAEIELVSQFSREAKLKRAIDPLLARDLYDFIILDCPPSLGLLTVNALTAAQELIVPIQCEYYALEGLGQLLRNVGLVRQNINPDLRFTGIVMTMFDPRTKLSEQVVHEVKRFFGGLVYDVIIPRTVRLSEAPGFGQPITRYDPKSRGAESYRRFAEEVATRPPREEAFPSFDVLGTEGVGSARGVGVGPLQKESGAGQSAEEDDVPTVGDILEGSAATQSAASVARPAWESAGASEIAISTSEPEEGSVEREQERSGGGRAARRSPPTAPGRSGSSEGPEAPRAAPREAKRRRKTPPRSLTVISSPDEPAPVEKRPRRPEQAHQTTKSPARQGKTEAEEQSLEPRVVVIDEDEDDYVYAGGPRISSVGEDEQTTGRIGETLPDEGKKHRRWRLFRKGGL